MISFALGSQREPSFQWNMGLRITFQDNSTYCQLGIMDVNNILLELEVGKSHFSSKEFVDKECRINAYCVCSE